MKKAKKILSAMTALVLAAGTAVTAAAEEQTPAMRDITTMELVKEMGLGINLGNTFEACGDWINGSSVTNYETAWGSPVITEETIKGYADEGFGVLRIPVAWSNMMGDDYTISSEYMARVKEVTDWAVDAGLYVIVNIHWDGGWWENFPTDKEATMYRYTRMWDQICDGFEEYDDHVMFESLNEEGGWSSLWNQYDSSDTEGKTKSYELLNEINQTFVDLVRSKGGNNAQRHLLIAGYITDISLTCDELYKMPNDPLNRCAVSVHYYTPASFALLDADSDWAKAKTIWGTTSDYDELTKNMDMLKTTFIDKGVPVIIGEYGVAAKNKDQSEINRYLLNVAGEAYDRELCPVLWDINYGEDSAARTYSIYNRNTGKINDADLKAGYDDIKTKKAAEITVDKASYVVNGEDGNIELNASATSGEAVTYKSYDESVATVDENGVVTPLKKGTTQILVSAPSNSEYRFAELLVTVRVLSDNPNPPADDNDDTDVPSDDDENNPPADDDNTDIDQPDDEDNGGDDDGDVNDADDTDDIDDNDDGKGNGSDDKNSGNGNANSSDNKSDDKANTSNPATGSAGMAVVIAAAAAAVVVSKKRK